MNSRCHDFASLHEITHKVRCEQWTNIIKEYHLYDESEGVENSIGEVKNSLLNIQQQKISEENVYQFLLYFDKLYDKFTDLEKKEFLNSFVEQVDIYEQEQPDGRIVSER